MTLRIGVATALMAVSMTASAQPSSSGATVEGDHDGPPDWSQRRLDRKVSAQLGLGASPVGPAFLTTPSLAFDFGWFELGAGAMVLTALGNSGGSIVVPRLNFAIFPNVGLTLSEDRGYATSVLFARLGLLVAGWPTRLVALGAAFEPIGVRGSWAHGPDITVRARLEASLILIPGGIPGTWAQLPLLAPGIVIEVALPLS